MQRDVSGSYRLGDGIEVIFNKWRIRGLDLI